MIDSLTPKLLIKIDFLNPYGIIFNYPKYYLTF